MRETQASIVNWSIETFGQPGSDAVVAIRANEEWVEFLRSYAAGKPDLVEIADTAIVLFKLATRWDVQVARVKSGMDISGASFHDKVIQTTRNMTTLVTATLAGERTRPALVRIFETLHSMAAEMCQDLGQLVDDKMEVNRKRTWKVDPQGIGYHVRREAA